MGRKRWAGASGVVISVVVHLSLAFVLLRLPPAEEGPNLDPTLDFAVLPDEAAQSRGELGGPPRGRVPVVPGGERSAQNVDSSDPGEGGDGRGPSEVVLLVADAHPVRLRDTPPNASGPEQVQRLHTSSTRASWENRRSTPRPDEQAYVASGRGRHAERRPQSEKDATSGAREAPPASNLGITESRTGNRESFEDDLATRRVTTAGREPRPAGGPRSSPGVGILEGRGTAGSLAARVAEGRPPLVEGPAATLATHHGRVRDNVDAELLAAALVQSMVESSPRRGVVSGTGTGGQGSGGPAGAGEGSRFGGRAAPHGPGRGGYPALDTSDRRYQMWHLLLMRRVHERLDFPRERMLSMDQGFSVYDFLVRTDGSLVSVPELVRSSGFTDFDHAARHAIERAAPFAPLPEELRTEASGHRVSLRIEHANPMVR